MNRVLGFQGSFRVWACGHVMEMAVCTSCILVLELVQKPWLIG